MNKAVLLFIFCFSFVKGYSQCKTCKQGKPASMNSNSLSAGENRERLSPPDSSNGLAQSYKLENVCGLNWQQTSILVETRSKTYGFNANGTGLPATVPITFSSCNVDSVVKAFLYFNGSYLPSYAANPAALTITNPASVVFNYLVDSIGTGGTKCWGDSGTIAYRADITNSINGGGNYNIDITGHGLDGWSIDGISLVIIYVDKSATYSGSIVLWDGLFTSTGSSKSQTFSGFNVCNATPVGQAFGILADMQSNTCSGVNTETYNGSSGTFPNLFYNFCTVTTPLTAGQTTTTYNAYTNNLGCDCYSWVLAGLYWQNTTCQTCNPTVLATQTISVVPPRDTVCQGDSVQLTASGASTYIWNPSTGLSCTNCPDPKASPNATTTYSVTGFNGCAFGTDTVTIVVEPRGSLTISPSTQICTGDSVQLTVSGGTNYIWKPSTFLSCTACANPTATPTATTTYTVVSGTGVCKDSATVTITVTPTPTLTVVPKNPIICAGGSVILTVSGASAYRWTPTTSLSCNTCTSPTASPTITTVYTVVGGVGTCRDTLTDTVFVLTSPTISVKAMPDSVCQGDTILLVASGGGTYRWSTGQTIDSIKVVPASTKTYTIAVSNGVCTDSTTVTVYITPLVTVATSKNDTVCPNTPVTLTATGGGGPVTYKWSTGATTTSINVSDSVTTTYTVTVTGKCNSANKTITVVVIPLPKPVIKGTLWKCAGVKDTLTVTGGTTYKWSNGTTSTSYITGPIKGDSIITVVAYNSLGCSDTTRFTITERIKPTISQIKPSVTCHGSPVTLTANAAGSGTLTYKWSDGETTSSITVIGDTGTTTYTVTVSNGCPSSTTAIINQDVPPLSACCDKIIILGDDTVINASGTGIIHFSWSPSSTLNCDTCPTVIATPTITTTYTVTGTDSLGCQSERIVTILVETPCFDFRVPNVFTPDYAGTLGSNGGTNNIFYIETRNITGWSTLIYDRWGKEMFKSTDPHKYWDGLTEGGGKAPGGVYYYIITGTCQNNTYKKDGFLQLIR